VGKKCGAAIDGRAFDYQNTKKRSVGRKNMRVISLFLPDTNVRTRVIMQPNDVHTLQISSRVERTMAIGFYLEVVAISDGAFLR
jgi:hypothetical protein